MPTPDENETDLAGELFASNESKGLTTYLALMLSSDGSVIHTGRLLATDDLDALAQAKKIATTFPVELWDRLRFIERIEPLAK